MAYSIGLDLGLQSIKVAVLDGTAKKPRVVDFIDHRLEVGSTTRSLGAAKTAEIVRGLFQDHKLSPQGTVTAHVPAASCLTREITVPFTRDDQIRKTIKFQAESYFHSIPIDELLVEHYKIAEVGDKSRLLVVGFRKDLLKERLELLQKADVDPVSMDLDCTAIYNAFTMSPQARENQLTLIVDLGGGSMKIVLVENGRLRLIRSFRAQASGIKIGQTGGGASEAGRRAPGSVRPQDLAQDRDDLFFAEEDMPEDEEPPEGRLPVVILDEEQSEIFDLADERLSDEARTNVLVKCFLEIDRSLASINLDAPLERILLTGGGAAIEGVEKAFADHFETSVERLALRGRVPARLGREQAEGLDLVGATALGLGLKGLGHDAAGLEFRKEEFAYAGKFDKAKRGLACTLVLLFVLFFTLAFGYQNVEMKRHRYKLSTIQGYELDIYSTLFKGMKESANPPEDIPAEMKKKQRELLKKHGKIDVPDVVNMFEALREFADGVKRSGRDVRIKEASFKQGQSSIMAELEDIGHTHDVKEAVNAKATLFTLEIRKNEPDPKDPKKAKATLQLDMKKAEKKKPGPPAKAGETAAATGG